MSRVHDDRSRLPARSRVGLALTVSFVLFVALVASFAVPQRPAAAGGDPVLATLCLGAPSLEPGSNCVQPTDGPVFPSAEQAQHDWAATEPSEAPCQVKEPFTDRFICRFGDLNSSVDVALIGNSHAVQWLPALQEIAQRRGLRITTFVSARCFAITTPVIMDSAQMTEDCLAWGKWARDSAATGGFDLIVQSERTLARPVVGGDPDTEYLKGYTEHLQTWADAGRTVLVVRDTPKPRVKIPECLMQNATDYSTCSADRGEVLQRDPLAEAARSFNSERMRVADLTEFFCRDDICPGVIGRVVVYFDASHLTTTYTRTLTPYLEDRVMAALKVAPAS